MTAFDDLLNLLPQHERDRLLVATKGQTELLSFYIEAHRDIATRVTIHIERAAGRQLAGSARLSILRDRELLSFIEDRIRRLNRELLDLMNRLAPRVSTVVSAQIPRELRSLGLASTVVSTPDPRYLQSSGHPYMT